MTIKGVVRELAVYSTSRDYARLAELATRRSVVCLVQHGECRDVAKTLYTVWGGEAGVTWEIGVRGICYVCEDTVEDFVAECRKLDVEFFEPPLEIRP